MKAVMVMYDSLNRHMLPNYGCDWTLAPNFIRLGERAVTFDNHSSAPCRACRRARSFTQAGTTSCTVLGVRTSPSTTPLSAS